MEIESGLSKVEKLIMPVSAGVTFFGEDIGMIIGGDLSGVIAKEVGYLKSWHPPTVLGLSNMIKGPLGQGAFTALAGWAVDQVGKVLGSGKISRIGRDFESVGSGVMLGGLADGLVRPSKYNPGEGGAPGHGQGDSIMRNPLYYERTGKAASSGALMPR
jgi:hypothetical protein